MSKRIEWKDGHVVCVLDSHETVANQCDKGDAAVQFQAADGDGSGQGWYVYFVGDDGEVNGWADPYATSEEAVQAVLQA